MKQPLTRGMRGAKSTLARITIGRLPNSHLLGSYRCPICAFRGPFISRSAFTGPRRAAQCPRCGALERHRLQRLVFDQLSQDDRLRGDTLLVIAPERFTIGHFGAHFEQVLTADLLRRDVGLNFDLEHIPLQTGSCDLVIASHVLEHVPDDRAAIAEINRILRPGGLAMLPVPIVSPHTVEYDRPNEYEDNHVRAPGVDYYDRYLDHFDSLALFRSSDFDEVFQTHLLEDRTAFPTRRCPDRAPMPGQRHEDVVAVAFKEPAEPPR